LRNRWAISHAALFRPQSHSGRSSGLVAGSQAFLDGGVDDRVFAPLVRTKIVDELLDFCARRAPIIRRRLGITKASNQVIERFEKLGMLLAKRGGLRGELRRYGQG
jgi:hypothetical protein